MSEILILETPQEKRKYQAQIEALFCSIFHKSMNLYEKFFINTPCGNAMVCYMRENKILGMGNITRFCGRFSSREYNYYLFTSSMIDESARKDGAYFEILNTIKTIATHKGVDFILAFPNIAAYPLLSTLGGFKLIGKYGFSLTPLSQALSTPPPQIHFTPELLQWRLSLKPYAKHSSADSHIVYKTYNNAIDVLHICQSQEQIHLPNRQIHHKEILMPSTFDKHLHTNPICMTFFPLRQKHIALEFSPILSDVF